jgi:hypothetical protein
MMPGCPNDHDRQPVKAGNLAQGRRRCFKPGKRSFNTREHVIKFRIADHQGRTKTNDVPW